MVGIYKITNPDSNIYIGQSINIKNRKDSYRKLACKKQPKIFLSLKKHGWKQHIFEIIEYCSIEQLNERETYWKQYYLDQAKGDWSKVLFCGLFDTGGGPKANEHKQNISNSLKNKPKSEQHKLNMKLAHLGKKRPKYIGEKISESKLGTKQTRIKTRKDVGIPKSDKHKQKMSLAKLGKPSTNPKKPILQYDKQGNFIKEWSSISEAGKELNIHYSNIPACCKGKKKTVGGFIWRYK